VAEEDGSVTAIEKAPQGGFYVSVGNNKQYVPPGLEVTVQQGDKVEAGDQLSDGLIDPEDVVRLQGLGAGRKYYADRLHQILEDSGSGTDKRNVEIMARGALDHVVIEDPDGLGGYLPDDVASYSRFSKNFTPPENTQRMKPKHALGQFLQSPALHYTIGTRISPKVMKHLESKGLDVDASPDAPMFRPELMRLRTATHNADRSWIAAQAGSYLKGNLQDQAIRGTDENIESNTHFVPRLSIGTDFAKDVRTTGKF